MESNSSLESVDCHAMVIKDYYHTRAGCIPGRVSPGAASFHSQVYTQVLTVLAIYPVIAMEHPLPLI